VVDQVGFLSEYYPFVNLQVLGVSGAALIAPTTSIIASQLKTTASSGIDADYSLL
jgi:hypothetical protein